jgi:hypothetical protein
MTAPRRFSLALLIFAAAVAYGFFNENRQSRANAAQGRRDPRHRAYFVQGERANRETRLVGRALEGDHRRPGSNRDHRGHGPGPAPAPA